MGARVIETELSQRAQGEHEDIEDFILAKHDLRDQLEAIGRTLTATEFLNCLESTANTTWQPTLKSPRSLELRGFLPKTKNFLVPRKHPPDRP